MSTTNWFETVADDPIADHFKALHLKEKEVEKELKNTVSDLSSVPPLTSLLAVDCEMVEVASVIYLSKEEEESRNIPLELRGRPKTLLQSQLARVSIVDVNGNVVLDSFVLPEDPIVDYRTEWSGITKEKLEGAPSFADISKKINAIITEDSYVVGQSIDNDLKVMKVHVPMNRIRDTALFYQRFHPHSRTFGLKNIASWCLGLQIQDGQHDSVIDARTALLVYRQIRNIWERTHPLHDPYPKNYWDPRPPPIPLLPELPDGFKTAVEELQNHQRPAPHYQSYKPGQAAPSVPQAGTFAPDLSPASKTLRSDPKILEPVRFTMDAASPPTVLAPVRFSMTGPPERISTDGAASVFIPTLNQREAFESEDPQNAASVATAPTIVYPIIQPPPPTDSPSNLPSLTTTDIIKAFYPSTVHGALKAAERKGLLRLNGPPFWVVPSGTIVDPDLNQVSVEKVLESLKVNTSGPGKKRGSKRKRGDDDGDDDNDEGEEKANQDAETVENIPVDKEEEKLATEKPLITGRMRRSMEWVKRMDEKDKAKKQREYARKKIKRHEFMAKLAAKEGGVAEGVVGDLGTTHASKKLKVGSGAESTVAAVKEFLKVATAAVATVNSPVAADTTTPSVNAPKEFSEPIKSKKEKKTKVDKIGKGVEPEIVGKKSEVSPKKDNTSGVNEEKKTTKPKSKRNKDDPATDEQPVVEKASKKSKKSKKSKDPKVHLEEETTEPKVSKKKPLKQDEPVPLPKPSKKSKKSAEPALRKSEKVPEVVVQEVQKKKKSKKDAEEPLAPPVDAPVSDLIPVRKSKRDQKKSKEVQEVSSKKVKKAKKVKEEEAAVSVQIKTSKKRSRPDEPSEEDLEPKKFKSDKSKTESETLDKPNKKILRMKGEKKEDSEASEGVKKPKKSKKIK